MQRGKIFLQCPPVVKSCPLTKTQLTRDFRAFIDESCSLQYGVELVLAGSEDDGSSGLTASEKRRQLRRYKALRDTLHPMLLSRNKVQFRGDEKSWDMQTGSLVLMRQGNLEFTQFASATRNTPKRVWELWLDWQDFIALDPRQDLLITFQLQQGRYVWSFLVLSFAFIIVGLGSGFAYCQ